MEQPLLFLCSDVQILYCLFRPKTEYSILTKEEKSATLIKTDEPASAGRSFHAGRKGGNFNESITD